MQKLHPHPEAIDSVFGSAMSSLAKWGLSTVTDRNASSQSIERSSSTFLRPPWAGGAACFG